MAELALEPRDLPIGVAGTPAGAEALERQLGAREGAFELHRYGTEAEAREAIEDREVYGAFVASPTGPRVLMSSAGSPVVAQLLAHAASEQGAELEDVVTTPKAGTGLGSSVLPLVLAGVLTGILSSLASRAAPRASGSPSRARCSRGSRRRSSPTPGSASWRATGS